MKISAPKVNIPDAYNDISYSPSNFPSFLYSYSDNNTDLETSYLPSFGGYDHMQEPNKITLSGAGSLNVGHNKYILCVEKQAFYLDLNETTITKIPPMKNSRINHTMTWIEGYPAVIGGLAKIEILQK